METIEALINAHANVNVSNDKGNTPLLLAIIQKSSPLIIQKLIDAGATNVDAANNDGVNALIMAAYIKNPDILEKLLRIKPINLEYKLPFYLHQDGTLKPDGSTPLLIAVGSGNLKAVAMLIDAGADFNTTDLRFKFNALQFAVMHGHLEIVKLLIKKGADIKILTKNGATLLHIAAAKNHAEIVTFLREQEKHKDANPSLKRKRPHHK